MQSTQEIIAQIDAALGVYDAHRPNAKYGDLSDLPPAVKTEVSIILSTTLARLMPEGTRYMPTPPTIEGNYGALRALRRDYQDGYLATVQGLVRAEVFTDFLEMAEHLLDQKYKDPAAVLVGGVLEEHLRVLCDGRQIPTQVSGKPKKADAMNNELASIRAYSKLDQKNVTAWLDLRNKAAHGLYREYNAGQVDHMLSGVREFTARVSA